MIRSAIMLHLFSEMKHPDKNKFKKKKNKTVKKF